MKNIHIHYVSFSHMPTVIQYKHWAFMRLLASYIVMTTWLTADHNKSETTQFNQFNTFIKNKSLKYKEN